MSMSFEEIANYTEADKPEYKGHKIFDDLDKYISFYDDFAMSVMAFATVGRRRIINVDTYAYSSIQGTLESIKIVLLSGRLGDAFALLRKYYDSITLNIYTNLYLEKNRSLEKPVIQEITNWLSGHEKLPHNTYGAMSAYIEKSEELKSVISLLYKDAKYKETRERCNDHMHYNYFDNVLINDNRVHLPNRLKLLNSFKDDLEKLFIFHLATIFYLNDHYMCSSDYLDYLEMGMTPEPESQYWVAPYIQDMFSDLIEAKRPDVAQIIKDKTAMHLITPRTINTLADDVCSGPF